MLEFPLSKKRNPQCEIHISSDYNHLHLCFSVCLFEKHSECIEFKIPLMTEAVQQSLYDHMVSTKHQALHR